MEGLGDYQCHCQDGWTGQDCQEDIDECQENDKICNAGICVNEEGSFQCYCKPGYTGSRCDNDFDECLSNPCMNNGTCANLVNSYSCTCVPGFNGEFSPATDQIKFVTEL